MIHNVYTLMDDMVAVLVTSVSYARHSTIHIFCHELSATTAEPSIPYL